VEDKIMQLLSNKIVSSPLFKIMVVDKDMNLIWCNKAHADMFPGEELVGRKCYETLGDTKVHKGCPTCVALGTGKQVRGLYDFGETNSQIVTIPLGEGLVAKIMMDVPKNADGRLELFE
jgi:hypothetical protein